MGYRVGVDIGGTFTDFCAFDDVSKALLTVKVLSTPSSPGLDVANGLEALREHFAVNLSEINHFVHGQTVGLNTVIQRNGAKLALLVTQNFRDVLELERLRLPDIFNLKSVRPAPLISRDRVLPVRERIRADGSVKIPLEEEAVRDAVTKAKELGCEGVVVSFLNAYRNPAHEQRAAAIARKTAPDLFVFTSSDIWPVIREFERTITAVLNGYVHPRVARYLTSLQATLKRLEVSAEPLIAKSNGGVMRAESGKTACAQVMLSGTAMGVMGASYVAQLCNEPTVLSLDMGGTSVDVALIEDANPRYGQGERIGDFQLFIPSVSVSSIGAGGGSVASVDDYGSLHVGPESAGSDPGPACYGRNGPPTLTDAFLVCGFLGEGNLGYGAVQLDTARACRAVEPIARKIGRSVEGAAQAIIDVAVSGMYLEFGKLTAKHGVDPRELVLLPFGGAGPMIACFLARELGIRRLVVPTAPGVLSSLGCLVSDVKNDFIRSLLMPLDAEALPAIRSGFAGLAEDARHWFDKEGNFEMPSRLFYSADMRYRGQKYEIEVPLDDGILSDPAAMAARFHQCHQKVFDYHDNAAAVEVVNLRLVILGINPKPDIARVDATGLMPEPIAVKDVHYDGVTHHTPVLRRTELTPGCRFSGPAIVVQDDTTTCILDGFDVSVDGYGHLIIEAQG